MDTLTGIASVHSKMASMTLIRWQFSALTSLVKEYELSVNVTLVMLEHNQVDGLSRVTQRWLHLIRKAVEPQNHACYCNKQAWLWSDKVHPLSKLPSWHKGDIAPCQVVWSNGLKGISEGYSRKVLINWPVTHVANWRSATLGIKWEWT